MSEISASVLAGGRSRRLGVDKSLLRVCGESLLERILTTLASLTDDLLVVADNGDKLPHLAARIVPDARPGMGPLGGIYSGLRAMRGDRGLFLACDMPLLNPYLLRYMVLLSADFDVVIPRIGAGVEPLHAVYSKACIGPIESSLNRSELRVVRFFPEVRVRYVEQHEIDIFDPNNLSFFNINCPADLTRAEELIEGSGSK
ncbi:MAG TPA: molybdenum cofactor guanylyltransferase [Anaerolineae bacterium]|nr:molybdenum cofactor guanylyltransferase [Anaerolineae bacterium]